LTYLGHALVALLLEVLVADVLRVRVVHLLEGQSGSLYIADENARLERAVVDLLLRELRGASVSFLQARGL
jgi:hypothetical protein